MGKLLTINNLEDESLLNDLFSQEITVYEDVQGSQIWVNYDGVFNIKLKTLNSEPINIIDLAMQNFYNKALNYFNSLSERVKGLLNRNWWFCFEYFPDNQPANIEYNRTPKNNLVLISINKNGKYSSNIEELEEYSRLFDCDMLPIIFSGYLNQQMIEAIKYFLNTSPDDLEYVFGEKSFCFFFYKILNPNLESSFLMDDDYQKNLEKLIIKTNNDQLSFQILNPLYKKISDTNSTEFVEIYTLILVNFLNFCQSVNLNNIKLSGNKKDDSYINLICKLYNMYITEVKDDILNFDFIVPKFFDKDKFRINTELLNNKLTKQYIEQDKRLEYIFKVILGSFNKKRNKVIGIFTNQTLNVFNKFIDEINNRIDFFLKRKTEVELGKKGLLDFGQYFDIQYDKDFTGDVYPDVYTEIENTGDNKTKKNKKDIGSIPENGKKNTI